ncbi:MAG: hypothetical protein GY950_05890 [bacterium]|nr:hypothetical protein [bacterium]
MELKKPEAAGKEGGSTAYKLGKAAGSLIVATGFILRLKQTMTSKNKVGENRSGIRRKRNRRRAT